MGDMAGGETLYLRSAGLDDTGVPTTSSLVSFYRVNFEFFAKIFRLVCISRCTDLAQVAEAEQRPMQ
jgi:hypothetical protein